MFKILRYFTIFTLISLPMAFQAADPIHAGQRNYFEKDDLVRFGMKLDNSKDRVDRLQTIIRRNEKQANSSKKISLLSSAAGSLCMVGGAHLSYHTFMNNPENPKYVKVIQTGASLGLLALSIFCYKKSYQAYKEYTWVAQMLEARRQLLDQAYNITITLN